MCVFTDEPIFSGLSLADSSCYRVLRLLKEVMQAKTQAKDLIKLKMWNSPREIDEAP